MFEIFRGWLESFDKVVHAPTQKRVLSRGNYLWNLMTEQDLEHCDINVLLDASRYFYPYKLAFDNIEKNQRRSMKRHSRELLNLIKQSFQSNLFYKQKASEIVNKVKPDFELGDPAREIEALILCDGSVRPMGSGCGFVLKSTTPSRAAEPIEVKVSVPCGVKNSLKAEWMAMVYALKTASALGLKSIRVHVDAMGLCDLLKGKASLSWSVEEAELLEAACQFEHLEVLKVPRVFNFEADRLAFSAAS